MKLRIQKRPEFPQDAQKGGFLTPHDLQVFLGDLELTGPDGGLCRLDLRIHSGEFVTAAIEIEPNDIEFTGDVLTELAVLARRAEEDGDSEEVAE